MIFTDVTNISVKELDIHKVPDNSYFRCCEKLYYKIDDGNSLDFESKKIRINHNWFGNAIVVLVDIKEIKYADLRKS